MRRFLGSKLTSIGLVVMVVTLITGVTWAATGPTLSSGPVSQEGGAPVEIQGFPLQVPVGGKLRVAGAGFEPGQFVLFKIIIGGDVPDAILQGGPANDAGAFLVDTTKASATGGLPPAIGPGVYTIVARTAAGPVAHAPLVLCESTTGKCPAHK